MAAAVNLAMPPTLWRPELGYWLCAIATQIYPEPERHVDAILRAAGDDVIIAHIPPVGPLDVKCLIADYGDWTVLAFEGTTTWRQLALQLSSIEQDSVAEIPGLVHAVQAGIAASAWERVRPLLPVAESGARRYILCGHSLGGAVAQMVAWRLVAHRPGQVHAVVTYGANRVGDRAWAGAARTWPVVRYETAGDIVPQLPPLVVAFFPERFSVTFFQEWRSVGQGWVMGREGLSIEGFPLANEDSGLRGLALELQATGVTPREFRHSGHVYLRFLRAYVHLDRLTSRAAVDWIERTDGAVEASLSDQGVAWPYPPGAQPPGSGGNAERLAALRERDDRAAVSAVGFGGRARRIRPVRN